MSITKRCFLASGVKNPTVNDISRTSRRDVVKRGLAFTKREKNGPPILGGPLNLTEGPDSVRQAPDQVHRLLVAEHLAEGQALGFGDALLVEL